MEVKGRDLYTGLPKSVSVTTAQIAEALESPVAEIVSCVKKVLEETPPELAADIMDLGIVLTGGGALLKNIEKIAAETFGCDCCVRGSVAPVNEALKSPTYATCLGLLQYALKPDPTAPKPTATSVWERVCDWFKG